MAMTGEIQKSFDELIRNVPRMFLVQIVEKKLSKAGVRPSKKLVNKLADAVMAGSSDSIHWDGDESNSDVVITFTEDDVKAVGDAAHKFLNDEMPNLVGDLTRRTARSVLKTLKQNWPEQHEWELQTHLAFAKRLEIRWGEGLNLLRMLLTVSRELGLDTYNKWRHSRTKKNRHRSDVLLRLHARACQVTGEIVTLIESGYADGAMARWRTLHEISVVATLIADNDNELAHRYIAHDFVGSKRSLSAYLRTHANLGYKPPAQREVNRVERHYSLVLRQFGRAMKNENGWAAELLRKDDPSFADLEAAAGKSRIRAHYKMACQSVHAGVKGITNQLGVLPGHPAIIAGASNAGLDEPGQNTAITLTQVTFTLLGPRWQLDDLVAMSVLADLQSQAVNGFVRAGRRLRREESTRRRKGKKKKK